MAQETNEEASWYELAFSRALTEPPLFLGVPKLAITANGLIAAFFVLILHFWPILPFCALLHFGMVYVCKDDPRFMETLRGYMQGKSYYET